MVRGATAKDYYATLGLPPSATSEEIRKAYRRLALEWHPDRRPGDPGAAERFREISEAYAVLINPSRRHAYDQARKAGTAGTFSPGQEDIFRDLFADPRASAIFEDVARELARMGVQVDRQSFHQTLAGGRVVVAGVFVVSPLTAIPALFRVARAVLRGARAVSATGQAVPPREVKAGAPRGGRGFLGALGRVGRGLLPGGPHPRSPAAAPEDVTLVLPLTPAEAEQGGEQHLDLDCGSGPERIAVTVPPRIRSGTRLRLRGKGRPGPDGTRGDAYLTVEIVDPRND